MHRGLTIISFFLLFSLISIQPMSTAEAAGLQAGLSAGLQAGLQAGHQAGHQVELSVGHQAAPQAPQSGAVLCLPGIDPIATPDCLPWGPSSYLERMAGLGITFPLRPVAANSRDPLLGDVPYHYAVLEERQSTPVYASVDDAIVNNPPLTVIDAGRLRYISYVKYVQIEKGKLFELRNGGWVQVASRVSVPRSFMGGLVFQRTPERSFGWIVPLNDSVETRRSPGFKNKEFTGHKLLKYDVVQIYAVKQVEDTEWLMVGPDEWIEGTAVGRVIINTTPPKGVTGGRWIEVNLYEQTLSVYDQNSLVFATLIASGLPPFWTRPGVFQVYKRLESTLMSGTFEADRSDFYYLEDVPWTLYYDEARALHGAYWRTAFGFPQSHGCVNLSPGDAHWLYDWARVGDWVYVWDPSGKTPTDPSYYQQGGA